MRNILLIIIVLQTFGFGAEAQNDSIRIDEAKKTFLSKQILPLGLITAGSLLNIGEIKYRIHDITPGTNFPADDYSQYMSQGLMYMYDIMGFKHQNSAFDQTKYLLISHLATSFFVTQLKYATKVQRPSGGRHSFPSGHTSVAFVGATVLYHEFKDTEPLLAYSGYLFATATGVLRMTNDAHWLPDVLAAAGIAIITTNLVYHFQPLKNFQPFKKKNNVTFIPAIGARELGLVCRF